MRVFERIVAVAVAVGLVGAVFVGVEAQTPPAAGDVSEPGVVGDPKAVLSRVAVPAIELPKLSVPTGDFSGMPGSGFGGESVDSSQRLPWRMRAIRPNGDPVRRTAEKRQGRGVDLSSAGVMGDDDRALYPTPSNRPASAGAQPVPKALPQGVKLRNDPTAWADEDVSVELPEKRTANSKTYANPDGSRTAAVFPEPVHAKTKAGWVDVDPTVRKKGNLLVADGGAFTSSFGPSTGNQQMVSLELADGAGIVTYSLVGALNVKPVETQDSVLWSEDWDRVEAAFGCDRFRFRRSSSCGLAFRDER
jgi:hypothetical protein